MNKGTLLVIGVGIGAYLLFFSRKARCYHILNSKLKSPDREFKYSECMEGKKNCPEYVNCMPVILSPGHPPPTNHCQIPAGCEGITKKVY